MNRQATDTALERCCPLCGRDNRCEMAAGAPGSRPGTAAGTPCWCVAERFPPELLARVPAGRRGKACICRRCVEQLHQQGRAATQ